MKLRYDPFQVFRRSTTPAGLYARQKWLGEAETPQWKIDFQQTVTTLWADHLSDGSWHHATVATIERLFGLHLTVRSPTAPINAALNWLLDKIYLQKEKIHIKVKDVASGTDLTGLPFIQSRHDMLITGAALFLATIFGREGDTDVLAIYKWLSEQGIKSGGQWIDEASSHNIFRAMVVHPVFAKDRATELTVHYLSEFQTDSGDWGNRSLFYQTLNALAHLNFPGADMQLEKAFKR